MPLIRSSYTSMGPLGTAADIYVVVFLGLLVALSLALVLGIDARTNGGRLFVRLKVFLYDVIGTYIHWFIYIFVGFLITFYLSPIQDTLFEPLNIFWGSAFSCAVAWRRAGVLLFTNYGLIGADDRPVRTVGVVPRIYEGVICLSQIVATVFTVIICAIGYQFSPLKCAFFVIAYIVWRFIDLYRGAWMFPSPVPVILIRRLKDIISQSHTINKFQGEYRK